MPPGQYEVIWNEVEFHVTPAAEMLTMLSGETVNFNGVYMLTPPPPGFVRIHAGSFTMGSPPEELGNSSHEAEHDVTLTTSFFMSMTEVSNQQFVEMAQWAVDEGHATVTLNHLYDAMSGSGEELLNFNDSVGSIEFNGGTFSTGHPDLPVEHLSLYGAISYCDWMSMYEGLSSAHDHDTWECNGDDPYGAQGYRLPTEAEWEHACRAGSETAFANGQISNGSCDDPVLETIGWYCGNAGDEPHAVTDKIANAWGLCDMHGNVWEMCNDWYGEYEGDETDPVGPSSGSYRVLRGGYYSNSATLCRSASRFMALPHGSLGVGFRPVRSALE